MAKKKRKTSKRKIRLFFAILVFGAIIVGLGYNLFLNVVNIKKLHDEKIQLNKKIVSLEEEKKELETDILKLKNPEYIAKYVREKYFYSKDGELILRIEE